MLNIVRRCGTLAAATIALPVLALAQSVPLTFSEADTPARETARGLFEREIGHQVAAGDIVHAETDLDGDGRPEIFAYARVAELCAEQGCLPRIFREGAEGWANVLKDEAGTTRGGPTNITLLGPDKGGFQRILLGSVLIEWDGSAYREPQAPKPSELDASRFLPACVASPEVQIVVTLAQAKVEDPVGKFCACMVDQFQTAGLPQGDLDLMTLGYKEGLSSVDAEKLSSIGEEFAAKLGDFRLGCEIEISGD